jgi:hypothetical protein
MKHSKLFQVCKPKIPARGHAGQALTAPALISKEETHRDEEILCNQPSDVDSVQLLYNTHHRLLS